MIEDEIIKFLIKFFEIISIIKKRKIFITYFLQIKID